MKGNYVTPKVIVSVFYEDVITASTPDDDYETFSKDWLD